MYLSSTDVNFIKNRRTKMTYKTSTENKALEIVNVKSLEGKVKQSMEAAGNKGAFGYIRGGSEDEWTLNENTSAFNKKQIMPRVLRGIDSADLSTSLFGIKLKTPISQRQLPPKALLMKKEKLQLLKRWLKLAQSFQLVLTEVHQWKTPQKQHQMHRNFSNYI